MNVPSAPPNAAPIVLNSAFPTGSPERIETIPITRGPRIGILPKNLERNGLALFIAGAISFAALPNNFTANPPILLAPLVAKPLPAPNKFLPTPANLPPTPFARLSALPPTFFVRLNALPPIFFAKFPTLPATLPIFCANFTPPLPNILRLKRLNALPRPLLKILKVFFIKLVKNFLNLRKTKPITPRAFTTLFRAPPKASNIATPFSPKLSATNDFTLSYTLYPQSIKFTIDFNNHSAEISIFLPTVTRPSIKP